MLIINTVVIVRGLLGRPDSDVAFALACFGGGSMVTALLLLRILDNLLDRRVMLPAVRVLGVILLTLAARVWLGGASLRPVLLVTWAVLGLWIFRDPNAHRAAIAALGTAARPSDPVRGGARPPIRPCVRDR